MAIVGFDHVAIPCQEPERLLAFYRALGFGVPETEASRESGVPFFEIRFGPHKINVHAPEMWQRDSFTLRGPEARPGCGDFCFVWDAGPEALRAALAKAGAEIIAGPVALRGARGPGTSTYVRDPEGNLLEFIVYPA